jgi:hypothetical protein
MKAMGGVICCVNKMAVDQNVDGMARDWCDINYFLVRCDVSNDRYQLKARAIFLTSFTSQELISHRTKMRD